MPKPVSTPSAPAAIGPYSQAAVAGGFVFCSMQVGLDPATGALREGIVAQTEQVLDNLTAVLAAAGASMADVVRATIYMVNLADFTTVNGLYAGRFPLYPPARSTVQVSALPRGAQIGIDLIAHLSRPQ